MCPSLLLWINGNYFLGFLKYILTTNSKARSIEKLQWSRDVPFHTFNWKLLVRNLKYYYFASFQICLSQKLLIGVWLFSSHSETYNIGNPWRSREVPFHTSHVNFLFEFRKFFAQLFLKLFLKTECWHCRLSIIIQKPTKWGTCREGGIAHFIISSRNFANFCLNFLICVFKFFSNYCLNCWPPGLSKFLN